MVDVAEHAHKLPTMVSGGQQQRVAIARALANDPPIIAADEPTGNLDSRTAEQVFAVFERLVGEGKTILMVTHDDDLARRVSRTVILADGEIVHEWLARALPMLSQELQVRMTHHIDSLTFGPGEPIIQQDASPDNFYVITSGEVHIYLLHPDGHETFVEALGPGQYFGEMALLNGGGRTATVRAARTGSVEVIALDKAAFEEMIGESAPARSAMQREANKRRRTQTRAVENEGR